jgi:multidrug efflux pump subunit AcrA (membrane-fusion protein)
MRAELGNADSELISGLFARIRLATSKPHDALLVPLAAIRLFEDVPAVLVVNDEHILEIRRIEPGQKTQDGLRVVKHGLAASDWVVVSDSRPLQAGMKVEPKQTTIGP